LTPRTERAAAEVRAGKLAGGHWTHNFALTATEACALGLPVKVGMPREVMELMKLYPQPIQQSGVESCPSTSRANGESEMRSELLGTIPLERHHQGASPTGRQAVARAPGHGGAELQGRPQPADPPRRTRPGRQRVNLFLLLTAREHTETNPAACRPARGRLDRLGASALGAVIRERG
jgi:serine dehydrogenase proteinase